MVIIDCHVHAEKLANFEGDIEEILSEDGKIELSQENRNSLLDKNVILQSMKKAGIDLSVLIVVATRGNMSKTRDLNDSLNSLCKDEKKFVGFGSVHPNDGEESLIEMERGVNELDLRGFKFHPTSQNFVCDDPNFIQIMKKAVDLDVPIIVDSYNPFVDDQPVRILKALMQAPQIKLILAHVGLFRFMDFNVFGFLQKTKQLPIENVYFDLTATPLIFLNSPFQQQFRWVTEQIGPDRLLFGSDYSVNSQKESIKAIKKFGYKKKWLPKILGENASKLLKI
ncbi:MAG: amidohydrolase family protein [Promethearchaeota archaeon]